MSQAIYICYWHIERNKEIVECHVNVNFPITVTLKVLVMTIDAQWEGMRDVGSARCELALLPPCPTIKGF